MFKFIKIKKRKNIIIMLSLFLLLFLFLSILFMNKNSRMETDDMSYANTIPPRSISGVIEDINVDKLQIKLRVTKTQLKQIAESEVFVLDFSRTEIDHGSNNPSNPTNKSRRKEVEKYSVNQEIDIMLSEDIVVRNNLIFVGNPWNIK